MMTSRNFLKLQQEDLNVTEIIDLVTFPTCGAISNFIGITRNNFQDKKVIKLQYEAYEPMALKEMADICTKIRLQWNVEGIAIYHRIGEVPVSKPSVVIAISSPHRKESLSAVEYAINTLKEKVPIWKKEVYETGEPEWKENNECPWGNNKKARFRRLRITERLSNNVSNTEHINGSTSLVKKEVYTNIDTAKEVADKIAVDPNLIQIRASSTELKRRVESFIERKRQQVNIANVQEFCCHSEQIDDNENSCARVDAILIRRKDSKSHMKVHRVLNTWGPQTIDQSISHKINTNNVNSDSTNFPVLDDRISVTERILGINKPVSKDIYERLKSIEDRILYLEGLSPEYKEFWVTEDMNNLKGTSNSNAKRTYTTVELDSKLYELEDRYTKKMK